MVVMIYQTSMRKPQFHFHTYISLKNKGYAEWLCIKNYKMQKRQGGIEFLL